MWQVACFLGSGFDCGCDKSVFMAVVCVCVACAIAQPRVYVLEIGESDLGVFIAN